MHITKPALGAIHIPVLSRDEQCHIADFLDRETAKIDAFVQKVRRVIEKLQEYRAALITAAVNGQIDVREELAETPIPTNSPHHKTARSEEG